jgi:hypothetical protein
VLLALAVLLLGPVAARAQDTGEEALRRDLDARLEDALQAIEVPDAEQLLEDGEASDEDEAAQIVADRLETAIREASDEVDERRADAPEAAVPELDDAPALEGAPASWVPLGALVAASLDRPAMRARAAPGAGLATLLPRLRAELRWVPTTRRRSGDTGRSAGSWQALALFEWRPGGHAVDTRADVLVTGGRAFVDDGRDRALLAAHVDRSATAYRQVLAARVTALYRRRLALVAEPPAASLAQRVQRVLAIREAEAQLDALTGGASSRLQAVFAEEVPR